MLDIIALAVQCGLLLDRGILDAIVRVESRGNPYALAVNGGRVELARAPRNRDETVRMARWLEAHGYNFDAGLAQVNSANFHWLGLDVESAFEPCANLRAASRVLHDCYSRASVRWKGDEALAAALSCYNTGDFTNGVRNGYAKAVRASASGALAMHARTESTVRTRVRENGEGRVRRRGGGRRVGASGGDAAGRLEDVFAEPLADAFGVAGNR